MLNSTEKVKKKSQYDVFFTRALLLLRKLSEEKRVAVSELAQEYNVNERTIKRDVDRLHFFPLTYAKGFVSIEEGFSIEHTRLSSEELLYMELAFDSMQNFNESAEQKLHSIRAKLSYPLFTTPYEIKADLFERIDMDSSLLNKIEDAITKCNISTVFSNSKETLIEPYKIVAFDGIWYLFAKDLSDNNIKTYLISTIDEFYVSTKHHTNDMQKVETMLQNVHTAWFEDGNTFSVHVKIKPPVALYFKLKKFFPSQEISKELKDGSLIVEFKVSSDEDVDNLIKAWLPHIEVLKPERFRQRIIDELEEYLQALKSPSSDIT